MKEEKEYFFKFLCCAHDCFCFEYLYEEHPQCCQLRFMNSPSQRVMSHLQFCNILNLEYHNIEWKKLDVYVDNAHVKVAE